MAPSTVLLEQRAVSAGECMSSTGKLRGLHGPCRGTDAEERRHRAPFHVGAAQSDAEAEVEPGLPHVVAAKEDGRGDGEQREPADVALNGSRNEAARPESSPAGFVGRPSAVPLLCNSGQLL
jgi:hypothetical protein